MRKIAAAVLAVPVVLALYVPVFARRQVAARLGLAVGIGGLLGVAAFGIMPGRTNALPASTPAPIVATQFGPQVEADKALDGAVVVSFSVPMDAASVEASLSVSPPAAVSISWQEGGRSLRVAPRTAWAAATYYTVTIGSGAHDTSGAAIANPVRAAFYTRSATTAKIAATEMVGSRAHPATAFVVTFDRPVDAAAAKSAFTITPVVAGSLSADSDEATTATAVTSATTLQLTFAPDEALTPGARYVVGLRPLADAEGAEVARPASLAVRVAAAPSVVRFRPRAGTKDVARDAVVSVRFTQAMDRASTARAFSVLVGGKAVAGKVSWAEGNTVLVFDPRSSLPYATTIVLRVADGARSAAGVPLDRSTSASFATVVRPKAVKTSQRSPQPGPTPTPKPKPRPRSGGTGAGSGSWAAAERYLLKLINCTRLGGWVEANGACSSPGGRSVTPLTLDAGISAKVARPYAKLLATHGACSHFYDGNPGTRLKRAGYSSYHWAENVGCRYFPDPMDAAVSLVRFFQNEKNMSPPDNGHWVNMMNGEYDRAGVGLWVSHGHLNFVIDFYHP